MYTYEFYLQKQTIMQNTIKHSKNIKFDWHYEGKYVKYSQN